MVIVVIAIVVVVVVLLLRRRKTQYSDEGVTNDTEFTEETVSTITADEPGQSQVLGEWSQTTEDNPLFSTQNDADDNDNPFTNAFEEGGFFNE